jgi:hypothetical protein
MSHFNRRRKAMEGRRCLRGLLGVGALLTMLVTPALATTYVENFDYPDGTNLNGTGGWTGAAGSQIMVYGSKAVLTYDNAFRGTTLTQTLATPISANTIWWHASVEFPNAGSGGNAFDLRLEDASGNAFARWYGGSTWERPRIGDLGIVLGNALLTGPDVWNDLLVVIDTVAKTSTFSLNGATLGTLNYATSGAGNTVGRIRMGFQNATTTQNGDQKYYDSIWVTDVPEPATMGLLVLGALFVSRRRART